MPPSPPRALPSPPTSTASATPTPASTSTSASASTPSSNLDTPRRTPQQSKSTSNPESRDSNESPDPNGTPASIPRKRLTRDQRRDILLMRRLGHTYESIATFLHVSQRAVQYTCQTQQDTPQHCKAGRPPKLSKDQIDDVEAFVLSSVTNMKMPYARIAETLWPGSDIGAEAIKYALHQRGYRRRGRPARTVSTSKPTGEPTGPDTAQNRSVD